MLRKIAKWTVIVAGGLVGLVLLAVVVIYFAGGRVLAQRWDIPLTSIDIPDDSVAVAEGQRLAAIHGCTGCHSEDLSGGMLIDDPLLARIYSPNLTKVLDRYSDDELVRVIRHGVWPDGKGSAAMPSSMFYHLSDRDVGAIIAFLRSVAPVENDLPTTSIRLMARLGLVLGQYQLQADLIEHDADQIPPVTAEGGPNGRYLAFTSCTECHGQALEGGFNSAPPLVIVRGYSLDEFTRLMQTGVPRDGRDLSMMGAVARSRFSHFSDEEIAALHGFLQSREP
jgi:mono/diheme cytochrome c family protein